MTPGLSRVGLSHLNEIGPTNLYLLPEPRQSTKKAPRCWNIAQLKGILGAKVCDNMLFVHALLGCDTTFPIYGLGKGVALQLIRTDKTFQEKAKVFRDANKKKEVIIAAGEKAIVLAHKGLLKII